MAISKIENLKSTEIKINEGDLIYGRKEVREDFFKTYRIKELYYFYFTVDKLNKVLRHLCAGGIVPERLKELADRSLELDKFAEQFESKKNETERKNYILRTYWIEGYGQALNPFIKKRCKLAILWILTKGKTIHFLLDGLDYENCFKKTSLKYTNSELRFIYRNWKNINRLFPGQVIFYHNNQIVEVPWKTEEVENLVKQYLPRTPEKYSAFFQSFFKFTPLPFDDHDGCKMIKMILDVINEFQSEVEFDEDLLDAVAILEVLIEQNNLNNFQKIEEVKTILNRRPNGDYTALLLEDIKDFQREIEKLNNPSQNSNTSY